MSYGIFLLNQQDVLNLIMAGVRGDRNAQHMVAIAAKFLVKMEKPPGEAPVCMLCDGEPKVDSMMIGGIMPLDERSEGAHAFAVCQSCASRADINAAVKDRIAKSFNVEVVDVSNQVGRA